MRAASCLVVAAFAGFTVAAAQAGEPVSIGEMDTIRAHVARHWKPPPGVPEVQVEVEVATGPDGTVHGATALPPEKPVPGWGRAALAARRALYQASPLPIPADRADQFKTFVFVFNTHSNSGR